MIPQELLGTAKIPGRREELKLYRHDRDFTLRIAGAELMSSRAHGSEELLAELALECIPDKSAAQILIGGLGMGYTLASVLGLVGKKAKVEVVEILPEVVDWNEQWLGDLTGHPLKDQRVSMRKGDVVPRIRAGRQKYDAILLDVDNGPEGLTRDANDRLYSRTGIGAASAALKPGGVLAIWSATGHKWFTDRLASADFKVTERKVQARRDKGPKRMIWLAEKGKG